MARINVSVPDSLRERMSALDSRVNWSEVAQTAFEREIVKHNFEVENMEQVIERLRASKTAFAEKEQADGLKHGRSWAQQHASYEELRTVANLDLTNETDYAALVDKALGNIDLHWDDSFWQDGDDVRRLPSNEYVQGFVDGALDVWSQVADKI
jgi:hypothetical protein